MRPDYKAMVAEALKAMSDCADKMDIDGYADGAGVMRGAAAIVSEMADEVQSMRKQLDALIIDAALAKTTGGTVVKSDN